jgi:hypothetical protein
MFVMNTPIPGVWLLGILVPAESHSLSSSFNHNCILVWASCLTLLLLKHQSRSGLYSSVSGSDDYRIWWVLLQRCGVEDIGRIVYSNSKGIYSTGIRNCRFRLTEK